MKQHIPWQIKVLIKIFLSKLPFNYRVWESLGLFKHGGMSDPDYAYRVFQEHFYRTEFDRKKKSFVALELGSGDSLFSSIIAHSFGAKCCYMVDAGDFASLEKKRYVSLIDYLMKKGFEIDIGPNVSTNELIRNCGGIYYTQGLESLKKIPDNSVDFVWSQAVLEHIRYAEFDETMSELKRVLRDGGACSHQIDLKDHLGGSANNLRFSSKYWESEWMSSSGFYTNRIRFKEMLSKFEKAGFRVSVLNTKNWHKAPVPRKKLAKEFFEIDNDNLLISEFDVILK